MQPTLLEQRMLFPCGSHRADTAASPYPSSIPPVTLEAHEPRNEATLQRTRFATNTLLILTVAFARITTTYGKTYLAFSLQQNIQQVSYNHYHNA
jgi:hypothetical protein